jgi:hypothetical protein
MPSHEPRYTVRVSEELRRLRRGLRTGPEGGRSEAPRAAPPADAAAPICASAAVGPATGSASASAGRFGQRVRLRRDGRRPLVFEGLPLASFTVRGALDASGAAPAAGPNGQEGAERAGARDGDQRRADAASATENLAEQTLALFLARDGRVVAQLRLLVPEQSAARPVHRVAELGSREDLQRFLAAYRPEEALWPGLPASTPGGGGSRVAALNTLRADFARVTAPLRDSFGECQI